MPQKQVDPRWPPNWSDDANAATTGSRGRSPADSACSSCSPGAADATRPGCYDCSGPCVCGRRSPWPSTTGGPFPSPARYSTAWSRCGGILQIIRRCGGSFESGRGVFPSPPFLVLGMQSGTPLRPGRRLRAFGDYGHGRWSRVLAVRDAWGAGPAHAGPGVCRQARVPRRALLRRNALRRESPRVGCGGEVKCWGRRLGRWWGPT